MVIRVKDPYTKGRTVSVSSAVRVGRPGTKRQKSYCARTALIRGNWKTGGNPGYPRRTRSREGAGDALMYQVKGGYSMAYKKKRKKVRKRRSVTVKGREISRYGLPLRKVRVETQFKDYDGETIYRTRIFNLLKMRFERN